MFSMAKKREIIFTEADLRSMLISEVHKAGSNRAFAVANSLSESYVSDVMNGRRAPGPAILAVLGLEVNSTTTTYRRTRKP